MVLAPIPERLLEKVAAFKEYVKQDKGVAEALALSKLQPRDYIKYYDEIWSDPEIAPFKPKRRRGKSNSNSLNEGKTRSSERGFKKPPDVREAEERLELYKLYEGQKSEIEKRYEELERELKGYERVLRRLGMVSGSQGVVQPPPQLPGIEAIGEELKKLQERRERILEMLKKPGFEVRDEYVRREEVESMVEEAYRRGMEEALDDKRINAMKEIIMQGLSKVVEIFQPAIHCLFLPPIEALEGGETGSQSSEEKSKESSSRRAGWASQSWRARLRA
ncbi:MAG: hypothetical protein QW290_07005 [Sulfolobales archaeon]